MLEELFAIAYLMKDGITSWDVYSDCLDALFMESQDSELLLELECCGSDMSKVFSIVEYWEGWNTIDKVAFGQVLFSGMEKLLSRNELDLKDFAAKGYSIWRKLPDFLQQEEPFHTLSYADDPLSWGDEKQSRELYESAFRFYDCTIDQTTKGWIATPDNAPIIYEDLSKKERAALRRAFGKQPKGGNALIIMAIIIAAVLVAVTALAIFSKYMVDFKTPSIAICFVALLIALRKRRFSKWLEGEIGITRRYVLKRKEKKSK